MPTTDRIGEHDRVPHPHEQAIRGMYDAINAGDLDAVGAEFSTDALWHGADALIRGSHAIAELVGQLREASGETLQIELHDVLANDDHAVALQVTRADRRGRSLADRVVYVFHMRDGKIAEA